MKSTMFDYLDWRGDLTFSESSFNEVDNIIFSSLVFIDFSLALKNHPETETITIEKGVEYFFQHHDWDTYKFGAIVPDTVKYLAKKVATTRRYKDVKVAYYQEEIIEEKYMQFCAAAFVLDDDTIVISFEGTDDTIVGWRENFNMFLEDHTYAQKEAALFVNDIAQKIPNGGIYLCGHSKGGNLAYYGGMFCDENVKSRIIKIINNDGPGLNYGRYSPEQTKIIDEKGVTYLPPASIVGMVMEQRGEIRIIASKARNIFQHNPYDLIVMGNHFIDEKKMTKQSLKIQAEIKKMFEVTPTEHFQMFLEELYQCITITNKKTLLELKENDLKMLRSLSKMSKQSKKILRQIMTILITNNAWIK